MKNITIHFDKDINESFYYDDVINAKINWYENFDCDNQVINEIIKNIIYCYNSLKNIFENVDHEYACDISDCQLIQIYHHEIINELENLTIDATFIDEEITKHKNIESFFKRITQDSKHDANEEYIYFFPRVCLISETFDDSVRRVSSLTDAQLPVSNNKKIKTTNAEMTISNGIKENLELKKEIQQLEKFLLFLKQGQLALSSFKAIDPDRTIEFDQPLTNKTVIILFKENYHTTISTYRKIYHQIQIVLPSLATNFTTIIALYCQIQALYDDKFCNTTSVYCVLELQDCQEILIHHQKIQKELIKVNLLPDITPMIFFCQNRFSENKMIIEFFQKIISKSSDYGWHHFPEIKLTPDLEIAVNAHLYSSKSSAEIYRELTEVVQTNESEWVPTTTNEEELIKCAKLLAKQNLPF